MQEFRAEIPYHFSLPRRIRKLGDLAYNLWWTWNQDAQRLFALIDKDLWERTYHNPIKFLRKVQRARLNKVTYDKYFLEYYDHIIGLFEKYMEDSKTWCNTTYAEECKHKPIAYLSTEFGLHETLPIYAGGLGVLSGDHLKEASDLGLPLVAIGFLYTRGYFSQHITEDGWQEARNYHLNFDELPVIPIFGEDDMPLTISVELPGREVLARLWEIRVGRIPLYLLDTDVEGNTAPDRELTARLYSSDLDLRISQEIILGIGGVRALRTLGYNPEVWHMNEGHSAFMALERAQEYVSSGHSFEDAILKIKKSSIFTTHTPVPAGSDEFPHWLIDKYFSQLWPEFDLTREEFIDLANRQQSWGETFSMPLLAFRFSGQVNGVSELHGQVAREMWNFLWPEKKPADVPISYVTNGIHTGTWLARRLHHLFNRYMGRDWVEHIDDPEVWANVVNIPDQELWAVRRHLKRKLVAYMRDRARQQWLETRIHPVQVVASGTLLDPYALTIGFARRFATYKRANLILRDMNRLLELINRPNQPVQIVFAGKAHPSDEPGKLLIQEVYRAVKRAENGGRLVFLDDYDMNLARYLVQGVDVWLNTPRRPNEGCGTSGQKAALNGVLNFSVLDGWWREGYNGKNGWAIGDDVDFDDPVLQDQMDAESLYDTLENEIIPLYYNDRSIDNIPVEWIARMKESVRILAPQFSMRRMVKEYVDDLYLPAMRGLENKK